MKTITLRIKKEYAIKLLEDLEKTDAISFVRKKNDSQPVKRKMLTKEDLIRRALESEKAIKEKRFITIDALEKEMKNW